MYQKFSFDYVNAGYSRSLICLRIIQFTLEPDFDIVIHFDFWLIFFMDVCPSPLASLSPLQTVLCSMLVIKSSRFTLHQQLAEMCLAIKFLKPPPPFGVCG